MKVLSWNVRGLNKSSRQKDLISFLNKNFIDIAFVLETRVLEANAPGILNKFGGWAHFCNYDHSNLGKIWVLWRISLDIVIVSHSLQHVLIKVGGGDDCHLMAVYGANSLTLRKDFYDIQLHLSSPLAVMGDFNAVVHPSETSNAHGFTSSMNLFGDWIDDGTALMDSEGIGKEAVEFYKKLLGTPDNHLMRQN
ncbi:hypothetical protein LINPERPRIM_LOCUS37295, partial [Linum perenne]